MKACLEIGHENVECTRLHQKECRISRPAERWLLSQDRLGFIELFNVMSRLIKAAGDSVIMMR
jgi:hypothetical protein